MFCRQCGTEVGEDAKLCPKCGASLDEVTIVEQVDKALDDISEATSEQIQNVYQDVKGGLEGKPNAGRLETNRSLLIFVLLNILTLGLYGWFFVYSVARDVNQACEGDGQKTSGLIKYILLCIITCGIYSLIWEYSLGNRLSENARKYNLYFSENGTTILLWHLFGAVLCGIGPFIAMNILIKNTNRICDAYNQAHGY